MSRLEQVLAAGQFAVTAEIGPPKHADPGKIRELKEAPGVAGVHINGHRLGGNSSSGGGGSGIGAGKSLTVEREDLRAPEGLGRLRRRFNPVASRIPAKLPWAVFVFPPPFVWKGTIDFVISKPTRTD